MSANDHWHNRDATHHSYSFHSLRAHVMCTRVALHGGVLSRYSNKGVSSPALRDNFANTTPPPHLFTACADVVVRSPSKFAALSATLTAQRDVPISSLFTATLAGLTHTCAAEEDVAVLPGGLSFQSGISALICTASTFGPPKCACLLIHITAPTHQYYGRIIMTKPWTLPRSSHFVIDRICCRRLVSPLARGISVPRPTSPAHDCLH